MPTYMPGSGPQRISECTYYFDYDAKFGWCWRSNTELLSSDSLAETVLKQILYLHEKVETGKVARREIGSRTAQSQWS
jgi:hypothetical protein